MPCRRCSRMWPLATGLASATCRSCALPRFAMICSASRRTRTTWAMSSSLSPTAFCARRRRPSRRPSSPAGRAPASTIRRRGGCAFAGMRMPSASWCGSGWAVVSQANAIEHRRGMFSFCARPDLQYSFATGLYSDLAASVHGCFVRHIVCGIRSPCIVSPLKHAIYQTIAEC